MRLMGLSGISEAVKQAVIQMAGSGVPLDKILDTLRERGIDVSLEDVAGTILEKGKSVDDEVDVNDVAGVMRWLIEKQLVRVKKLLGVESMSPIPLAETTNNLKILADLVIKYGEMTRRGASVRDLKAELFGGVRLED
jgi:hypothetical protein